jgi:hypothetical protein
MKLLHQAQEVSFVFHDIASRREISRSNRMPYACQLTKKTFRRIYLEYRLRPLIDEAHRHCVATSPGYGHPKRILLAKGLVRFETLAKSPKFLSGSKQP